MTTESNVSPEEKLLKLIKSKGSARRELKDAHVNKNTEAAVAKERPAVGDIIRKINWALMGVVFLFAIYLIADLFIISKKRDDVVEEIAQNIAREKKPETAAAPAAAPSADTSAAPLPARDLFKSYGGADTGAATQEAAAQAPAEDPKANLGLLGIISGDNTQAIVQNKADGKTYFLYKGDTMGEMTVLDVTATKIIFDYHGKKIELSL